VVRYSQERMAKKKATTPSWPAARLLSVDLFPASLRMRRGDRFLLNIFSVKVHVSFKLPKKKA